ncbi:DUF4870 domain-containing protein [Proteiniborus sp. MB09-C3]|uniref:DUF4870 domain-containing protein n=1 Tax=Proteiniborus sp. MB09-C3 TaxID=3050072 RepID=UPI00255377F7|nr:DUF4870 domain-containing protein [Proteiniborus sp. MB09-C3]WIV11221.1 DUF4870 domain-containing protein [Proteiniborus sp. MB09-C3]
MLTTEQKLLCALAHLGVFVGIPIIAPIIALLVSNDNFVKMQAKEALGFQIMLIAAGIISGILVIVLIGIPLLLVIGIVTVVFPIIAIVKVIDGVDYSYPISGSIIRKM